MTAAMGVTGELHEQVATGGTAREADGRHGRLGARGDQAHALDGSGLAEPHTVGDQRGEFDLALGRSAEREPAGRRLLHRGDDLRVRMPEKRRTPRGDEIDVLATGGIGDPRALRRGEEPRRAADRSVGAHRRVDPTGNHRAGSGEQVVVAVGHEGELLAEVSRAASRPLRWPSR